MLWHKHSGKVLALGLALVGTLALPLSAQPRGEVIPHAGDQPRIATDSGNATDGCSKPVVFYRQEYPRGERLLYSVYLRCDISIGRVETFLGFHLDS